MSKNKTEKILDVTDAGDYIAVEAIIPVTMLFDIESGELVLKGMGENASANTRREIRERVSSELLKRESFNVRLY